MLRASLITACGFVLLCGTGCVKSGVGEDETAERNTTLYRQAFAAEQSGDIEGAIRLYNRVLIEEPKSFSAHFQLATLLQDHKEDYVGAIYHYNQYLYFRPESDKNTLAQERIRIAEQLLAPKILRSVGDSVQGISQAHLLKENDRLNRIITSLEGEKSVLQEAKTRAEKDAETLRSENARLREILSRMRAGETDAPPSSLLKRVEAAVRKSGEDESPTGKSDGKSLKAMREEASAIANNAVPKKEGDRKAPADVPSTDEVLKKVQNRLTGASEAAAAPQNGGQQVKQVRSEKFDRSALSALGLGRDEKKSAKPSGEPRTYVVQPGDSLFRVAEKFYGDSTHWKKIRDANRTRMDPDGRIRAGQILVIP